jgi:hypothetical protein
MKNLKVGDKIKLNENNIIRIYEVKEIENGKFKLFNKFKVSFFADSEYIANNLIK